MLNAKLRWRSFEPSIVATIFYLAGLALMFMPLGLGAAVAWLWPGD